MDPWVIWLIAAVVFAVGEKVEDLLPFDSEKFVASLFE